MSTWPPTVGDVKTDAGITTSVDDVVLATELAAAIAFVQGKRKCFNYDADPLSCLPSPTDDLWLGTVRLAGRWHTRRRSPDGLIDMGDMGAGRVPSVDPDIERLLGIGRFRRRAFA